MKKIILSILMLSGLLVALEQDVTVDLKEGMKEINELNQQFTPPVVADDKLILKNLIVDIEKKFDTQNSPISYIIDEDKKINVKLNFTTGYDDITIKEVKKLIANIKDEKGVNKILLDVEASTVNDFKEILLLKKELEFEKNKVQELLNLKDEFSSANDKLLEKIKNIQDEIKKSGFIILFIAFSLGVVLTLYVQLEIDFFKRDKEELPPSKYILNYGLRLIIVVCLIIFAIQSMK